MNHEHQNMDAIDPRCLESDVGSVRSARDVVPKRAPTPTPSEFARDQRVAQISRSTIETALRMIEQHGCCWGPDVADAENELMAALAELKSR